MGSVIELREVKESSMVAKLQLEEDAVWKERFRAPVIAGTQMAKLAPERGLAVSNQTGKHQLYAWHVPTGALRQLTERPTGITYGELAPDGRFVYYLDDKEGNEIGHYVRIPYTGGEAEDLTPGLPPYSSFGLSTSRVGNRIGFTVATAEGFQTYTVTVGADDALGEPRRLFQSRKFAWGPALSHGGEIGVMASTERTTVQHYNLLAYDVDSGEEIGELWDGEGNSVRALMFSPLPGDMRLLGTTNRSGRRRPLIWDVGSGARQDLALAELGGEVLPVDWSWDGRQILLIQTEQAVQHLFLYDLAGEGLTRLAAPGGTLGYYGQLGMYFGPDDEIYAQWQDSTHPAQLIVLDGESGTKVRTALAAGEVPPGHKWRSVVFPTSDGDMIQGWLGLPEGDGPFPTILHTHGGPESVMTEVFHPASQAWIDHGFAFLTINYRGSTTFGRAFQEKIWGNPGKWEVEDMVAARSWLIDSGIADSEQVLLTGWSYGGYNTLMALGKRPELWAGGMAGVAIADWTVMYEDSADTLRGYQVALFGGTPDEKAEEYRASSPITYAEQVEAPVLIIQGRNDTRTPARPVEMYEARLKALGKRIEVAWFDAGHMGSSAAVAQAIKHQEVMLRFAYEAVGG